MKDELPDLSAFLSKKGGNAQAKSAENPPEKTDLSSKLSALVKKPGGTMTNAPALSDNVIAQDKLNQKSAPSGADNNSAAASVGSGSSWADLGAAPQGMTGSTSWGDMSALSSKQPWTDEQSSSSSSSSSSVAPAQNQSSASVSASASASWDKVDSFSSVGSAPSQSPAGSSGPAATNGQVSGHQFDEAHALSEKKNEPPAVADNREMETNSGAFSTRPLGNRGPSLQPPGADKFKAPQARPMSTLSSGAPVLKAPAKPAPKPAPLAGLRLEENNDAVVVPKAMQLPSSTAPAAPKPKSEPTEPKQESKPEPKRAEVPPSWPAQPTAPPRIVEKVEKIEKVEKVEKVERIEKPEAKPPSVLSSLASTSSSSLAPAAKRQETEAEMLARAFQEEARHSQESEAEKLARAFQEEAKALEEGRSLPEEPVSPAAAFAAAAQAYEGGYDSPGKYDIDESEPSRGLGFGNLLGGAPTVDSEPQRSRVADLMIPTGQQQAVFGRDRNDISGFDEPASPIPPAGTAPIFEKFNQESEKFSPEKAGESKSTGLSALFSTEIVTSGQDYGDSAPSAPAPVPTQESSGEFLAEEPSSELQKPDIFAQLMQAVSSDLSDQQHTQTISRDDADKLVAASQKESDFSSSFDPAADTNFSAAAESFQDSFKESFDETNSYSQSYEEDMSGKRTADEMFGAGGSSMGSDEELKAADAVFGGDQAQIIKPAANSIDPLPMAFGDPTNFQQMRLEDIKLAKRAAKEAAKEAAKKAAEAEAQKAEEDQKTAQVAENKADSQGETPSKQSLIELIEKSNAAKLEQVQSQPKVGGGLLAALGADDKDEPVVEPPAREPAKMSPKSTLSSLLAQANEPDEEDIDEEPTLGGAIADAFDKLLGDAGVDLGSLEPKSAGKLETPSPFAPSAAKVDKVEEKVSEAAQISATPVPSESKFAPTAQSAQAIEQAMTGTQSKADALSRLLEVANKAPSKPAEEAKPSDSASKLAEMINKPPGKISRQMPGLEPSDFNAGTSPFAASQFTSPFAPSPSSSQSQMPSSSSSSSNQDMSASSQRVGMPEATISNDAVSARIAALNRKLEEQTKVLPSASRTDISATPNSSVSLPPLPPPPAMGTATGTTTPSVNSLSQMPNLVDDSPASRAELVNRILGSAKISQQSGNMPEVGPSRSMPEMPAMPVEAPAPGRQAPQKGQKPRENGRSRGRGGQPHSFNPMILVAIVAVIGVLGGGYYVISSGMLKIDLSFLDKKPSTEVKLSIDQLLKNGEFEKVIDTLETKLKAGKITASEQEKLTAAYMQKADKLASNDEESEAIKVLEKVPSKSKKYKEVKNLIRKLKKKVKKN